MRADIVLIGLLSIPFSVGTSYAREALVLSGAQEDLKSQVVRETPICACKATWYGGKLIKPYTASGERFNPSGLTAAHKSLPLGTIVRVTDQHSGRHIVVRVNDREPDNGIRCIDLTEGAAIALGIFRKGVADVEITALSNRPAIEIAEAPDKSKLSRKLNKTSN